MKRGPPAVVLRSDVIRAERAAYVNPRGEIVLSSRETPSSAPKWKTGTWMVDDDDHEIFVLRRLKLSELVPTEFSWAHFREPFHFPRIRDAERYAMWMEEGKTPPPIRVVETWKNDLKVVDGHRRLAAHALLGKKTILAWTSPIGDDGRGITWEAATGLPWPPSSSSRSDTSSS